MLNHLFVDMNSYFASVEQQLQPKLRGRPVAVAAVLVDSTCCIAASYEAKAFGVKTGTPLGQARRLCPDIQIVEARPDRYVQFHHQILAAIESCIPVEKILSIDEASCRLLGPLREPEQAVALALRVKRAIREQVGPWLRCSIGLAPNRILAKVASDMQKPDGLVVLKLEDLPQSLFRLKLDDLPGIGPNMLRRLNAQGIQTIEQLCSLPEQRVGAIWGSVVGRRWWYWLRGHDLPEVPTRRQSVGHSHVLPPELRTMQGAYAVLIRLVHKAAVRLRRMHYWASRMSVYISFSHREEGWERSVALGQCQDTLTMIEALASLWSTVPRGGAPMHVAVTLHQLTPARNAAQPMFAESQCRVRLAHTMDWLNITLGRDAVHFGCIHHLLDSAPTRIGFTSIPDLEDF